MQDARTLCMVVITWVYNCNVCLCVCTFFFLQIDIKLFPFLYYIYITNTCTLKIHTHTHTHTHIPKNMELTTDFCFDSEGISDYVKADINVSLRAFKHLSNFVKNILLCKSLVQINRKNLG
jgi:hypothetical protein